MNANMRTKYNMNKNNEPISLLLHKMEAQYLENKKKSSRKRKRVLEKQCTVREEEEREKKTKNKKKVHMNIFDLIAI